MKSFKEAIKTSTVVKLPDQITLNIKQNFFNVIALEEKELCLCPNMQYLKLGAACCFITDCSPWFSMWLCLQQECIREGVNQNKSKQGGQRINSQTLHHLFGTRMLLCVSERRYKNCIELCQSGSVQSSIFRVFTKLVWPDLLQGREMEKEGMMSLMKWGEESTSITKQTIHARVLSSVFVILQF